MRRGQTERVTSLERRDGRDIAVEAGGLIFGAFLAAPAGSFAPFIAAAAAPFTQRMAEKIAAEWSRKSGVVASSALRTSGFGNPEHLAEALTGDADMIALTQKILFAASATGNDRKLCAFGGLLRGAARRHGRRLEETNLLIDALADLEDVHMVIMDVNRRLPQISDQDGLQPKSKQKSRSKQTWYLLA